MIRTRFPPEPNGYLHLGHVKAMLFDFAYHPGCDCTLRLDDTNPEAEKQEYVTAILEDVRWLGFEPSRITYTSDYFGALYDYAEQLVREGKAYVDFSSAAEIKEGRATGTESKWRARDASWHLTVFRAMRDGYHAEGTCVLRLKIDMAHVNPNLRDPIAYRIKKRSHYRTGDTWCIYPSYDYSHGIVDALEGITHSYCTSEFYIRRPQYMWPVVELGLVPATVVEFGRLNVEGVTLSKRKIIPLVESGVLEGFDDPRLFTLRGLRRRGFTPAILKELAGLSSIGRQDTELSRDIVLHHLRSSLSAAAPKAFAVLDPLIVHSVEGRDLYIDRADFREVDSPDYYRLAPGKTVRLRYDKFITYRSHDLVSSASPGSVTVTESDEAAKKVKGIIHWLPVTSARPALFEIYEDIDVSSSKVVMRGFIGESVICDVGALYQFERVGYFRFDRWEGLPVFIKIVGLLDKFNGTMTKG